MKSFEALVDESRKMSFVFQKKTGTKNARKWTVKSSVPISGGRIEEKDVGEIESFPDTKKWVAKTNRGKESGYIKGRDNAAKWLVKNQGK